MDPLASARVEAMLCRTLALLLTTAAFAAPPAAARVEREASTAAALGPGPTFVFNGRGWGHGVGMSQYGARGYADHGVPYAEIVAHYYPGTVLGRAPVARVRVLLAEGKKLLRVGSTVAFKVRDAAGAVKELPAGVYELGPGLELELSGAQPEALVPPFVFSPAGAPLELNGKPYRGTLELSTENGRLRAINTVALEPYLYGVVPDEMPHDWPAEALKAQAVVARSYALAVRKPGPFDLYADVRSQVYGGVDAEEPASTQAVQATAGQVLLFEGKVATTFFFSTSGGRTADIADVWANAQPTPYLVSVPDPYDSISPLHTWGPVVLPAAKVAKPLGVALPVQDARTTLNRSGRVAELYLVTPDGEVPVPATTVRTELGLRSTWFRVGVLSLQRPERPVVFGSRTALIGLARGLKGVTLEQRPAGGAWATVGPAAVAKGGAVTVRAKPAVTTWFRLGTADARSAPVRVLVAPRVRLDPPTATVALSGTVTPVLAGATVVLQRQRGETWANASSAKVNEQGTFMVRVRVMPGSYRAMVLPSGSYATALSPVLRVE
jgi:stage II sporulation protein D